MRLIAACLAIALFVGLQSPMPAAADIASVCTGSGAGTAVVAACTALIASGKLDKDSTVVAYVSRANAYEALGQHQKAVDDYTQAIAIKPSADLYFYRAYANEQLGQDAPSIADYSQAILLKPDYLLALTRRGYAYLRGHDYPHAAADFNAALALNPSAPLAVNGRGLAYQGAGKYDLAIADFGTIIAAGPDIDAYRNRANTEFYLGHVSDAALDFGHVAALKTSDPIPVILQHIARLRAGQSDPDFATATASFDQTAWPAAVIALFLGKGTEPAVFAQANGAQQCQAQFMIGEWYATQKQFGTGVINFTQASQLCSYGTFEYQASLSEMQR
ncbi:MAG TPA: tetratricopeptide repeat protein [Verrucomicrobiae bacterium]|jgi:tetratricopeptide (TPR) repeat protein|nr:tetratricopeptide repeat protein [Verrucomicrobiae bacterium]